MALSDHQRSLLRDRIHSATLVDSHAHNLVSLDSSFPFLRCFSEAEHEAMRDIPHTLSFKRSLRDIATIYGCEASLDSIQTHRRSLGDEALCSKCIKASNISAVLIDDGLKLPKMHDLEWHKHCFPNVYRVLRIETLAEDILSQGLHGNVVWTLDSFLEKFASGLKELSKKVVAFKSIAAYRGGLDIDPLVTKQSAEEGLEKVLRAGGGLVRITDKHLGDLVFLCGLEVATSHGIPVQVHTGFGDRDLDLRLANPLHLRSVLEDKRFSESRLVLLHASYPFSKEASYLASVYSQVFLDFGLAVPKLSVSGMHSAVSELLELAPLNKIMFSTDGYAFPETYFLGVKWARETLLHVLSESCAVGDLAFEEALKAADDILGNNAIALYKLELQLGSSASEGSNSVCQRDIVQSSSKHVSLTKQVRLLWCDGSGQRRCRVVPKERYESVIKAHGVGLTMCCMGMSSHTDGPAERSGLTAVGEIRLMPDIATQLVLPWSLEEELVLVDMHSTPGAPWEYCPRSTLKRLSDVLLGEFGLVLKAGFENEFYILKPSAKDSNKWVGLDSTPYCSSSAFDAASAMLLEISKALGLMGVTIEQLHVEAGGGQFEFALQYSSCLKAADDVLLLRETVKALVQKHGLLATFLPKFFPNDIGSGSHVHLSIWKGDKNVFMADTEDNNRLGISKLGQEFLAGVFHHLPSILAFAAPLPNSYARIKPHTWSGAHHCWGRENREAPLRAACPPGTKSNLVSNFELKSFDGCANPHLGLAAILAAGIHGLRLHLELPEPIDVDPSSLEEGTVPMLPTSLEHSVTALENDEVLTQLLGLPLTNAIIAIRRSEIEYYKNATDASTMLAMRY